MYESMQTLRPGFLDSEIVPENGRAACRSLDIDPRVEVSFRGGSEDQAEAMAFLIKAMMIALAVMAIILVTQFNSIFPGVS